MINPRRKAAFRWWYKRNLWYGFAFTLFLIFVRLTKGAFLLDSFAFISRPFWPGTAQKEWITNGINLEQQIRLDLLEKDNQRLRTLLDLKNSSNKDIISAAVISRRSRDFWQQLELNKGSNHSIQRGDAVMGPGGLLGIIQSVTPTTSRTRLLTDPGSKLGVWIENKKVHGVLVGIGTNRPQLNFLEKVPNAKVGDIISTSPASTLVPPNLPVAVIQLINSDNLPSPYAVVQLIASPEAIDWVQILRFK
ncbi:MULTISPECIES: rod shape-determining protein MreC [Prochlorococcus]|uniref:Cell shape-determining protein MreC n=1 Tax=Prochlorococcus marinus (strain SARG / CCMP1375 / SS120) TaxID=167539 RepID=Q7V9P7_PROMA|nr:MULTISPECIES: rod shape-determining protein MreC [Prochlorococcus]AAQ00826.1 Cell shape-determining protein [Prochlorococcus marinus subsp. marinus str. CCMP1375]KGG10678.1 Rod shape-determining protein MreC [Prochlorococcus marinus str. LG]KGG21099.1 Rod shape-determining protein MreC [Prochlorococcus marinus str. SS2]KGG23924.1 Rod shape-determining protein MreC [Prochlorococcus marinus str. SS35]KGG31816.1 Rod shape-determining protein MreC [Prochlorococcus marinus str. SS51]